MFMVSGEQWYLLPTVLNLSFLEEGKAKEIFNVKYCAVKNSETRNKLSHVGTHINLE